MKKLVFILSIVFVSMTSFVLPSCEKETEINYKTVTVTSFESSSIVTFTGEQGQGTFVFTSETEELELPDHGTYSISGYFSGGCGGFRVSTDDENILLVMPQGGTETVTGKTIVSQYYASVNCE